MTRTRIALAAMAAGAALAVPAAANAECAFENPVTVEVTGNLSLTGYFLAAPTPIYTLDVSTLGSGTVSLRRSIFVISKPVLT